MLFFQKRLLKHIQAVAEKVEERDNRKKKNTNASSKDIERLGKT